MKIGIDARELEDNPRGVGRVLLNILKVWGSNTRNHHFVLYFKNSSPEIPFLSPSLFEKKIIPLPSWINRGSIWEQVYLPRFIQKDGLDAFFSPSYTIPLKAPSPTAVMVHDISFETHPEWFSLRQGILWRWLTRWSVQRADRVICCSQFTRQELMAQYGENLQDKISTVYYAPQENFKPGFTEQQKSLLASRFQINQPFFLFVGSLFKRRNIPMLIKSFKHILKNHPEYMLVLVGSNTAEFGGNEEGLHSILKQWGMQDKVLHFDYLNDENLIACYQGAYCLVYPSVYEGFGFPVVEAMACGVPVIIPHAQSVEEISAGAAIIVDPLNEKNLAEAMAAIIDSEDTRQEYSEKGLERVKCLSWEKTAGTILDLIESL